MFAYVHYVMTEDVYTELEREELKEASLHSLQVGQFCVVAQPKPLGSKSFCVVNSRDESHSRFSPDVTVAKSLGQTIRGESITAL